MTDIDSHNDRELFSLIAQGNETAFRQLLLKYGPQIKPVIREIIRNNDYVKDIIQDIFLHLWLSREKLPEVELPRSWIFRMVYFQSYAWLRQKAVREKVGQPIPENMEIHSINVSAEDWVSFQQTRSWVLDAIQMLPPKTRSIYLLSREEGLKISEIAERLHIAPQTVKNTLNKAIRSIRESLGQKGIWLPVAFFFCTIV